VSLTRIVRPACKYYKDIHKLERLLYILRRKILKIEIFDLHKYINFLDRDLSYLTYKLINFIPIHI